MFNKCRKCRRKRVFENKKLKENTEIMKKMTSEAYLRATDPKKSDKERKEYEDLALIYHMAAYAMEIVLFDL